MQKQVFVCGTLFHIYISILKMLEHKRNQEIQPESLLIVNDHTPGIQTLIKELEKRNYFSEILFIPFFAITKKMESEKNVVLRAIHRNKLSVQYVENNSSISGHYTFIQDAEINLFYNLGLVSSFFLIHFPNNYFRMLEDGFRNYNPRVGKLKALKRKYILKTPMGEGIDDQVKSIEVQHPNELPTRIRHKGKPLNFTEMQESLSISEREELISAFLHGKEIKISGEKNALLITQPLSEDRIVKEETKLEIYNELLKKYAKDYTLFIKTHPREITQYKEAIEMPFTEIPRSFPLEFLDFLNDIRFDLGITVFSSALDNLKCVDEKVFMGKKYLEKFAIRKF